MDELGREVKPHKWLEPSVGLAGFCLAQNLLLGNPAELSVELSSCWGQQPAHICVSWGAVVLLICMHS